jgi:hypothetical protein
MMFRASQNLEGRFKRLCKSYRVFIVQRFSSPRTIPNTHVSSPRRAETHSLLRLAGGELTLGDGGSLGRCLGWRPLARASIPLLAVQFRNARAFLWLVLFGSHLRASHAHRLDRLDNHDTRRRLFDGLHPDHLDRQITLPLSRDVFLGCRNLCCRALRLGLCRHRSRSGLSCAALRHLPLRRLMVFPRRVAAPFFR